MSKSAGAINKKKSVTKVGNRRNKTRRIVLASRKLPSRSARKTAKRAKRKRINTRLTIQKGGIFAVVIILLAASLFAKAEPNPPLVHDVVYPQSCRGTWRGMNNIFVQDLDAGANKNKFSPKNSAMPALGETSTAATEGKEKYNAFNVSLPVLDQNDVTAPINTDNLLNDTNGVNPSDDLQLIIPDSTPLNGTNNELNNTNDNAVGSQPEEEEGGGERVLGEDDVIAPNDASTAPTESVPEPLNSSDTTLPPPSVTTPEPSPSDTQSEPPAEISPEQPVIINLLDNFFNSALAEDTAGTEAINEPAPTLDNLNSQNQPDQSGEAVPESANPSLLDNIIVVVEKIGDKIDDTFDAITSPLQSLTDGNNYTAENGISSQSESQLTQHEEPSLVQEVIEFVANTLVEVTDFIIPLPPLFNNQSSLTEVPNDVATLENGTIACADFSQESMSNIQRVALGLSMNSKAGEGLLMAEYTQDRQSWYSLGPVDLNPPLVIDMPQYYYVNFPTEFDSAKIDQTIVRLRWYGYFNNEDADIYLDSFWLDISSVDDGQEKTPELKISKRDFAAFEEPVFDLSIDPSTPEPTADSGAANNLVPKLEQSIIEKYKELIKSWIAPIVPESGRRQSYSPDYGTRWGRYLSGMWVREVEALEAGQEGGGASGYVDDKDVSVIDESHSLDYRTRRSVGGSESESVGGNVRGGQDSGVVGNVAGESAEQESAVGSGRGSSESYSPDYGTGNGTGQGGEDGGVVRQGAGQSIGQSEELEVGVRRWREGGLDIVVRLLTKDKEPTDIVPELQKLNSGKYRISLAPRSFKPGAYILETTITKGSETQTLKQDFSWGVLVVNTDQSVYKAGDEASLSFGVLSDKGETICDATVEAKITDPNSQVTTLATVDGTIKPSGFCAKNSVIDTPDYTATYQTTTAGNYSLTVTATTAEGSHTITKSIMVQDELPYRVRRFGASRIYPLAKYVMTIEVTTTAGLVGTLIETVPAEFVITPSDAFTLATSVVSNSIELDTTKIAWQVKLAPGEIQTFTYEYDAPDISPEIFSLGKFELTTADNNTPAFTPLENASRLGLLRRSPAERDEGRTAGFDGSIRARGLMPGASSLTGFIEFNTWEIASDGLAKVTIDTPNLALSPKARAKAERLAREVPIPAMLPHHTRSVEGNRESHKLNKSVALSFDRQQVPQNAKVQLVNPGGEIITDGITLTTQGDTVAVDVSPDARGMRPGKYTLDILDSTGEYAVATQDYTWGVLAFNPDYAVYPANTSAYFSFGVLDDAGRVICDAGLVAVITDPAGNETVLGTGDGSIRVNEECYKMEDTQKPDYEADFATTIPGTYQVTVIAKSQNGERTLNDSFSVDPSTDFYLKRTGPTRTYHPATYTYSLDFTAKKQGTYDITEKVPASFTITGNGFSVTTQDQTKLLHWQVAVGAGEAKTLSYRFKGPPLSPYLFLLGPAEIKTSSPNQIWVEPREWMLASDNACSSNVSPSGNWSVAGSWTSCGGVIPTASDTVTIVAGDTITLNTNTAGSIDNLTINSTGVLAEDGGGRYIYIDGAGTLFTNNGTFTAGSSIVDIFSNGNITVFSGTFTGASNKLNNLYFAATIATSTKTYTMGVVVDIAGTWTSNPQGTTNVDLNVTLSGTTTVTGLTTLDGYGCTNADATSNRTVLNTGTDQIFSTGSINIKANGESCTLQANASIIKLTGTSSPLFTRAGTFTQGTSDVQVTSGSGTPTLLSAATTFYNLTINSAATVINMGAFSPTIDNKLYVQAGVFNASGAPITGPGIFSGTLQIDSGATLCLGGTTASTTATCNFGASDTTARAMPLFLTYTFNAASTVSYLSDAATTVSNLSGGAYAYGNLKLNPKFVTTSRIYTFGGAMTINGDFTINPDESGASTPALTVNLAGAVTVAAGKTTTITRTNSATSTLDLRPSATDYNLTTGSLSVAAGGTLDGTGAASTITVTDGGTPFTLAGTYNIGSTLFSYTSATGATVTATTYFYLYIQPAVNGQTFTLATGTTTVTGSAGVDSLVVKATCAFCGSTLNTNNQTLNVTNGNIHTGHSCCATNGKIAAGTSTITVGGNLIVDVTSPGLDGTPTLSVGSASGTGNIYGTGGISITGGTTTLYGTGVIGGAVADSCSGSSGSYSFSTLQFGDGSNIKATTVCGNFTASAMTISANHTLSAGSYTITLNGTSGTLFTRTGTFTQGTSTVQVTSASGTPTLLSAATTFHILTINSAATVINMGAFAPTINNAANAKLYVQAGVFNASGAAITGPGSGNGTLQIDSGATLCLGGTTASTTATCNSGASDTTARTMPTFQTYTFNAASTVSYLSDAATTVSNTPAYGNLKLNPKFVTTSRAYTLGGAMTINGNFDINPDESGASTPALTVNAAGTITLPATKTTTITRTNSATSSLCLRQTTCNSGASYDLSTGLLSVATGGTLDCTSCTSTITISGTGAAFTRSGTFTYGTSKVSYTNGTSATILSMTGTGGTNGYYDLKTGGAGTYTLGGSTVANHAVNVSAGTLALSTYDLTVGTGTTTGDIYGAGAITQSASGTTLIKGAGVIGASQITTCGGAANGSYQFYNLTVGDNANAKTTTTCGNFTVSNLLTIAGGVATQNLDAGAFTITLSGTGTVFTRNGTFTYNTSKVSYTNATSATILSMTGTGGTNGYYNLDTNGAGTYTLGGDVAVNNVLSITAGNLTASTYTITIGGTGAAFTRAGTFTYNTSKVSYTNGTSATVLGMTGTGGTNGYYNLDTNGAGTYTLGGDVAVNNVLSITAGNLTASTYTITIGGTGAAFTRAGTFTYNTSKVSYTNATSATILSMTGTGGTNGYYNLDTNGAGTYTAGGAIVANNDVTVTLGTLAMGANALTVNGGDITVNGTAFSQTAGSATTVVTTGSIGGSGTTTFGELNVGTASSTQVTTAGGNFTVAGVLTIVSSSGTNELDASSRTITLSGSGTPFVNNETFTYNTSTVKYTGGGATTVLSMTGTGGTNGYYKLTTDGTGPFNAGGDIVVNNELAITSGTFNVGGNQVSGATVTVNGGTLNMATTAGQLKVGTGGLSMSSGSITTSDVATAPILTTTGVEGTNFFTASFTGGTLNVAEWDIRSVASSGIVLNGATVTNFNKLTLSDTFQTTGGTDVMVDATALTTTFDNWVFPVVNGAREINVRANTSGTITMTNFSGAFGGEAYDSDNGGTVTWVSGISIAGTVYSDEGSTRLSGGPTVRVKVNGAGDYSAAASNSGCPASPCGDYSIASITADSGTVLTIYLDDATPNATTVSISSGLDLTGIDLYQNRVIVRYETGSSITNTNLDQYDSGNEGDGVDGDIGFTVTAGALTVSNTRELHVWTGKTFTPGGTVTTNTGGSGVGGDVHIVGTFTATTTESHSVGASWTDTGTFNPASSTVTFAATSGTKNITSTGSSFYNLIINGSGGEFQPQDAMAVTNDLTVTAGTLSGTQNITVNGNVTGAGIVTLTGGTFEQIVSADKTFGSSSGSNTWTFSGLKFNNSSGAAGRAITPNGGTGSITVSGTLTLGDSGTQTITFDNNTANDRVFDLNGALLISTQGSFTASNSVAFTIATNFTNNGTFTHSSGTVTLDTTGTATLAGTGSPAITFYNFTSTTAGKTINFTASQTFRINGALTIAGTSGSPVNLHSTSSPTQWTINHQGTENIVYADVDDSACDGSSTNISLNHTSTGTNDGACWLFPSLSFTIDDVSISLDLNSGNTFTTTVTNTLTVTARAGLGYSLTAYETGVLTHTAYPSKTIVNWTGAYPTGSAWASTCIAASQCGFGYNTNDSDIGMGTNYSAFSQTAPGDEVARSSTAVTSEATTITYRSSVSATQVAGPYQTTIIYIVTPQF